MNGKTLKIGLAIATGIALIILVINVYEVYRWYTTTETAPVQELEVEWQRVYDTTSWVNVYVYNSLEEYAQEDEWSSEGAIFDFTENIDSCLFSGDSVLVVNRKDQLGKLYEKGKQIASFAIEEQLTETPMYDEEGEELFQLAVEKRVLAIKK